MRRKWSGGEGVDAVAVTEYEAVGVDAHHAGLADAIAADGPWPATDRSAMDGFAVAAGAGLSTGVRLSVVGQSLAGRPFDQTLLPGCAVRIMTGAVVPAGAEVVRFVPPLTIMGLEFASLIGGAFVVEMVFAWPGMAAYGIRTILQESGGST